MKKNILSLLVLFLPIVLFSCDNDEPQPETKITSITTNQSEYNVTLNESFTISVSHSPSTLSAPEYNWSVQPSGIIYHLGKGEFYAASIGEAEVTISVPNTTISTKCKVVVNEISISNITLSETSISLVKKQSTQLTATVSPKNATNKEIVWSTSDANIATVDNDGIVTAISVGNCKVSASSKDGKVSADCDIEVTPIVVNSISLSSNELSLVEGETASLIATISPEDADDKSLNWQSSDANTVAVNSEGKVSAIKTGQATITCSSLSSGVEAKCVVFVSDISNYVTSNLSTGWTSFVSSSGSYQGYYADCSINNNSNMPIQVISYMVKNGNTIVKNETISISVQGKNNYSTRFYTYNTSWQSYKLIWTYKYNGKEYSVSN